MVANNTRIFGIGTSGLVGSRVTELLVDSYQITPHSSRNGFDITDAESLGVLMHDLEHSVVLHMAAKTDVDGCERDKEEDIKKLSNKEISEGENFKGDKTAWEINVLGTKNVVRACRKGNKKLIFVSTDFVFSGEDTPKEGYSEDDAPSPVNWYAETKYEGEKIVRNSGLSYLILRISYPYRKEFSKKDFVRAVMARLSNHEPVRAITDHIMTPTYIDDIAFALKALIEANATGIYHVVGSQFITPYDAVAQIANVFKFDTSLIQKTTRTEFFKDRAPRPFILSIKNDKIESLGVKMRTFTEGLEELLAQ